VTFAVTSNNLYTTGRFGYPGFPVEFQERPEFLREKAVWVDSRRQLEKLVCWADVVVVSSCRVFEIVPDFYRFCQIAGTRVVIHADHTDFGTLYPPNIDAVCMQSEFFKDLYNDYVVNRTGNSSTTNLYVTGSVRNDLVFQQVPESVDREEIFRRYDFDEKKPLALWLPSGPALHDTKYKEKYRAICDIVAEAGFNIAIKGHPSDYAKRKSSGRYGSETHSWDVLTPEVPVVALEDSVAAIRACDVGITIDSSVVLDLLIYKKPMIFVDRVEMIVSRALQNIGLPVEWWSDLAQDSTPCQYGLNWLTIEQSVHENIGSLPIPKTQQILLRANIVQETRELEYIGTDTKLESLTRVLNSLKNKPIQDGAQQNYDRLVRVYHHKIDGKRHRSIVNLVENEVLRPHLSGRSKKSALILGRAFLFRLKNEGRDVVRVIRKLVEPVVRGIIEGRLPLMPHRLRKCGNDRLK